MKRSSSPKRGITVTVRRAAERIVEVKVTGHAGFAPRGRDIVCAAVSALVMSAAHGIATHCRSNVAVYDEPNGDYRLEVPRGGNAQTQAVLESTLSGLGAIARAYPRSLRIRMLAGKPRAAPKRTRPIRAART